MVTIRGALPLGEVVTAVTPLATALAELSAAGVVHGDVAPANVLFTDQGRPALADLSAAWLIDDGWPETIVGTTGFVAPEVIAGRPPTPASDVWSLGALIWYARTGGGTPPGWVGDLHWGHPPAEVTVGAGSAEDVTEAVGPELRPLLLRLLADDPDARPTAAEAALGIYRLAVPEPVVLVGRHPDPAAAVTNRIRREAAETRSRTQLRALERSERRRASRIQRSAWWGGRGSGRRGMSSAWGRVAAVLVAGLVLAGDVRTPGLQRDARETPVERLASGVSAASAVSVGRRRRPTGHRRRPEPLPPRRRPPTRRPPTRPTRRGPRPRRRRREPRPHPSRCSADPTMELQRLADLRAAALAAADPVALVGAEPEGTAAYAADVATVARLRDQRQRYRDLAFTVRSAHLVSQDGTTAVVRADRGPLAYTVEGEDGSTRPLAARAWSAAALHAAADRRGWRLTDVGSG